MYTVAHAEEYLGRHGRRSLTAAHGWRTTLRSTVAKADSVGCAAELASELTSSCGSTGVAQPLPKSASGDAVGRDAALSLGASCAGATVVQRAPCSKKRAIGYSDRTCSEICLFSGAAGLLANASCLALSAGLAVPSASPSAFADPSLSASAGSFGCEAEASGLAFMSTGACGCSGTLSGTASGALPAAGVLCLQQRAKRWQRPSAVQHDGTEPNASCRCGGAESALWPAACLPPGSSCGPQAAARNSSVSGVPSPRTDLTACTR